MLGKLSFTNIIVCIFIGYISYSIWTLGQLFRAPECTDSKKCLHPLIQHKQQYQLLTFTSIKKMPEKSQDLTLIHSEKSFEYEEPLEVTKSIELPVTVRANGTLHFHIFITSPKVNWKNWNTLVGDESTIYTSVALTEYAVPESESFNLLNSEKEGSSKEQRSKKPATEVTHIRSVIVFNLLTQPVSLPRNAMPQEIGRSLRLNRKGQYIPIIHMDLLSLQAQDLVEVKPDIKDANITIKYYPISYGKLRMWIQFETALNSMTQLGFTSKDVDEVKGIFSGSNLYLLLITFVVAALHLVFDFLAFKNDISFWRGLDSMGGISPSTVAWRAFAQVVVFLYLMEEKTSLLVLGPAVVGCVIELWKVCKAFHVSFDGGKLQLKSSQSKEEDHTRKLDSQGLYYLTYVLYPLCAGGAVYSLLYMPHKSWYSWVINSLVNGVYAFGFLFMMPQLFINYKLKSVAHMPWKSFMYKAFNTFIDDLFAFIITMPTAHRVACFRDDLVFLVYLYQRWLYPVDKSRVNEFGQKGDEKKKKQ